MGGHLRHSHTHFLIHRWCALFVAFSTQDLHRVDLKFQYVLQVPMLNSFRDVHFARLHESLSHRMHPANSSVLQHASVPSQCSPVILHSEACSIRIPIKVIITGLYHQVSISIARND